jgi:hypothetical protein
LASRSPCAGIDAQQSAIEWALQLSSSQEAPERAGRAEKLADCEPVHSGAKRRILGSCHRNHATPEDPMLALMKTKPLTQRNFAEFGRTEMAYVKAVRTGDRTVYAIHAADGTHLWQFDDRDVACAALRQHDMTPLSVH